MGAFNLLPATSHGQLIIFLRNISYRIQIQRHNKFFISLERALQSPLLGSFFLLHITHYTLNEGQNVRFTAKINHKN